MFAVCLVNSLQTLRGACASADPIALVAYSPTGWEGPMGAFTDGDGADVRDTGDVVRLVGGARLSGLLRV